MRQLISVLLILNCASLSADVIAAQEQKVNQHNFKGTLDGAVISKAVHVSPNRNMNFPSQSNTAVNPWSDQISVNYQQEPMAQRSQILPKANPWAVEGDTFSVVPAAYGHLQGFQERNPYTDRKRSFTVDPFRGQQVSRGYQRGFSEPFNGFDNTFSNGYYRDMNPAGAEAFANSFWPTNVFMPRKSNSSFPFMPW